MVATASARRVDRWAVQRIVGRLDRAAEPPWLAREVARRLGERLDIVKRTPSMLIDASGWLGAGASQWSARYPTTQAWSVEPDPDRARQRHAASRRWWQRLSGSDRAPALIGPQEPWPRDVGLVWSNLALAGCADPPAEIARWHDALGTDGFVMFTSLGPGTLPELREIYAEHGWGPPALDFVDMHDLGDMLVHAGLADPVMDQETLTITWRDADAAIAELRSLGGNAAPDRHAGWRTPRWRERLAAALAARARDGAVRLSFEVVYGHAFKGAPPGETRVSLDAMRGLVRAGSTRTLR